MDLSFKVKRDGKWETVARYGVNKFGNLRLAVRKPLLVELLKAEGDWMDLSVFEDQPRAEAKADDSGQAYPLADDMIPL